MIETHNPAGNALAAPRLRSLRQPCGGDFLPGEWCPFCRLTLRSYQAILPEIGPLGATLVAISPQTPDASFLTVQQQELTYPVLSDVEYRVVRQYTPILHPPEAERSAHLRQFYADDSWELPAPGAFVLAEDGVLTMAVVDAEYTQRLEPSRWFKPAPGLFNQCQSKGLKLVYYYSDAHKASWLTMNMPSCCRCFLTKGQRSASKRISASVDFAGRRAGRRSAKSTHVGWPWRRIRKRNDKGELRTCLSMEVRET